jgi:hypothetical protein
MRQALRIGLSMLSAIVIVCCGGGGPSDNGNGGVNVSINPTSANVAWNGTVQFSSTVTGAADTSVTWSASGGSITPTGSNTATFTAPAATTVITVTATSVADPTKTASATVNVSQGQATVTGRVRRASSSLGIAGVVVEFRNAGGSVLATVTTPSSGNFSVAVPVEAVRFHLRNSSVPPGFYKQYQYNAKRYTTLDANCSAPLPPLSANVTTPLATDIVIPPTTQPPPPPPDGCS